MTLSRPPTSGRHSSILHSRCGHWRGAQDAHPQGVHPTGRKGLTSDLLCSPDEGPGSPFPPTHPPPGSASTGGKGLTSDLRGCPLIRPRPLEAPVVAPGGTRWPLACPPASLPSRRPAFICSQGADSQRTTPGPAPACDAARLLRAGCKSPDRPQSGPRARVPHPCGQADSGRCV